MKKGVFTLLVLLLSAPVQAKTISVGFGKATADLASSYASGHVDNGNRVTLALTQDVGDTRLGMEAGCTFFDDADFTTLSATGEYAFPTAGRITPFIGGRIGVAHARWTKDYEGYGIEFSDGTAFLFGLDAGIRMRFAENASIDLGYRIDKTRIEIMKVAGGATVSLDGMRGAYIAANFAF